MDNFSIPELLKLAEKRFYTWTGLFFTLILVFVIGYAVTSVLGPPLSSVVSSSFEEVPQSFFSYCTIGLYASLSVSVCFLWFFKRRVPRFKEERIGILFSSTNLDELTKEVQQLRARIIEELKNRDLFNLIDLKDLPPNQRIEHAHDALAAINVAKGALLIWGNFQTGQMRQQRHAGFQALNFTYRHPSNVSHQYHQQIRESLRQRKWTYVESNDFVEKSVVANNIAQVALFIIGLTLLAWGKLDKADAVLGPLDVTLDPVRQRSRTSSLAQFCALVRKNRLLCITLLLSSELDELLWRRGIYSVMPAEMERWKAKLTEAISLNNQNFRLYHLQATVFFLCDNINEALRLTKRAKKWAARAESIPDFSLGFLHLYKGEVRKGLQFYRDSVGKEELGYTA